MNSMSVANTMNVVEWSNIKRMLGVDNTKYIGGVYFTLKRKHIPIQPISLKYKGENNKNIL